MRQGGEQGKERAAMSPSASQKKTLFETHINTTLLNGTRPVAASTPPHCDGSVPYRCAGMLAVALAVSSDTVVASYDRLAPVPTLGK